MHPDKVVREKVRKLTDLPNVGAAVAADLMRLGITEPGQLADCCPLALYDRLAVIDGVHSDPCMLDTFMSLTRFADGEAARPWWYYTAERKAWLAGLKR